MNALPTSPRPWHDSSEENGPVIWADLGWRVARVNFQDDADLIVKAVNHFDDMVSAIKDAHFALNKVGGNRHIQGEQYDLLCDTANKLSTLLKQIEGEEK